MTQKAPRDPVQPPPSLVIQPSQKKCPACGELGHERVEPRAQRVFYDFPLPRVFEVVRLRCSDCRGSWYPSDADVREALLGGVRLSQRLWVSLPFLAGVWNFYFDNLCWRQTQRCVAISWTNANLAARWRGEQCLSHGFLVESQLTIKSLKSLTHGFFSAFVRRTVDLVSDLLVQVDGQVVRWDMESALCGLIPPFIGQYKADL